MIASTVEARGHHGVASIAIWVLIRQITLQASVCANNPNNPDYRAWKSNARNDVAAYRKAHSENKRKETYRKRKRDTERDIEQENSMVNDLFAFYFCLQSINWELSLQRPGTVWPHWPHSRFAARTSYPRSGIPFWLDYTYLKHRNHNIQNAYEFTASQRAASHVRLIS